MLKGLCQIGRVQGICFSKASESNPGFAMARSSMAFGGLPIRKYGRE